MDGTHGKEESKGNRAISPAIMALHQQMVAHCLSHGHGFMPGEPPWYSMHAIADFLGKSHSTISKLKTEHRPAPHPAGEFFDYTEFAEAWKQHGKEETDKKKTRKR